MKKYLAIIVTILCVLSIVLAGCTHGQAPVGKVGVSTTPRVFTSQPTSQDFPVAGDMYISGGSVQIYNGSSWSTSLNVTLSGVATGTANITGTSAIVAHGLSSTPVFISLTFAGAVSANTTLYTTAATTNATSFTIYSMTSIANVAVYWRATTAANK